jgi:hypothetical protein
MTAIWGPLGWMTLHSTAFAYSDTPTSSERELMYSWLNMFRDTITCPSCREHFTQMLGNYRNQFPNMLSNRQEFILFTFRAHNSVNKRLSKPVQTTVEQCLDTLRNNVKQTTAKGYRNAYFTHISKHWSLFRDVTGLVALKKINELRKIDTDYVTPRDKNFAVGLASGVVVLPQDVMAREPGQEPIRRPTFSLNASAQAGFRITAGGIRLRR